MKWLTIICVITGILCMSELSSAAETKRIYGYVEKATLVDKNLTVSAKMDTGAKSASLSAINIKLIEEHGRAFLQFVVPTKRGNVEFIAPYLGHVNIKVRAGEQQPPKPEPLKRPVVLMKIKIGNQQRDVRVNLANRKRFNYPLLLGRDAIKLFSGIIDPSQVFIVKSNNVEKHEVK